MIRKKDEVIVINYNIDDDDDDVVQGVFVKKDQINRFSVSGEDHVSGQEMVNWDKNNELSYEGEALGHGKQKITPRMVFPPKMKGKTHGRKSTNLLGFP